METIATPASYDFKQVDALIAAELHQLENIISEYSASDVPVVQDVVEYLLRSGGKRMRLKLVLLAAKACLAETNNPQAISAEVCEAATVMEFIHSATLLHDDVVDSADTRRQHKAARVKWGNEASVLVGDFMYSRAFQLLATRNNTPLMHLLAYATAQLSEGEVYQLTQLQQHSTTEESYFKIIAAKTGALFAASAKAGAMLVCPDDAEMQQNFYEYGMQLGIAFQVMDDILDYSANASKLGKMVGKDLLEGKITLPLLYALQDSNSADKKFLLAAIDDPSMDNLPQVQEIFAKYYSLDKSYEKAQEYVLLAQCQIQSLFASEFKQILLWLADFALRRDY